MDTQSVGVGKSQGAERARKVPPKQGGKEEGPRRERGPKGQPSRTITNLARAPARELHLKLRPQGGGR